MNYADNFYHFGQDNNFLYFAGINRPYLALVIDTDTLEEYIFCDAPTFEEMICAGPITALALQGEKGGIGYAK
jgi:Xaa-Pro aminopeptidase